MNKDKNNLRKQQSERNSKQPLTGKERENPAKRPRIPRPDKPVTPPSKPEINPEPAIPAPGIKEPEINDPTRIDEPPPVFNSKNVRIM
ncbi:MAG: hypothetical protein K0M40_06015 [Prolixibacteraceae bacterium]|nr:hypothetical protein [Prolixibacteraceae bacterium]